MPVENKPRVIFGDINVCLQNRNCSLQSSLNVEPGKIPIFSPVDVDENNIYFETSLSKDMVK